MFYFSEEKLLLFLLKYFNKNVKLCNKFWSLPNNRSTDNIVIEVWWDKWTVLQQLMFYAVHNRDRERNSQRAEQKSHRSQTVDIGDRDSGSVVSRNCTFERDDWDVHGTLLRAGNWIRVPRYQLRKTSVHALTTSHVLTYDGRGVNGYATGSRWIWVARLTLITVFIVSWLNYFNVPLFDYHEATISEFLSQNESKIILKVN